MEYRRHRRRPNKKSRILERLGLVTLAILTIYAYLRYAPDRYNLAAPLDLRDRPTFVTRWKLQLVGTEGCYAALERAGVAFERLPDEVKGPGCALIDVARLDQSFITWGQGVTLRCPVLAELALWEQHVVQPAAEKFLGAKVVRVQHFGTYACRNVNNAPSGRRSEHATANAVDVAGFVLADGQEVSVLRDWGKRTPAGRFLRRVHAQACDRFNTVLGPEYNALHHDHFHFDQGAAEVCE